MLIVYGASPQAPNLIHFGVSPQTPPTFLKKGWTKNFGKWICALFGFSVLGCETFLWKSFFGILGKENNADTIFQALTVFR